MSAQVVWGYSEAPLGLNLRTQPELLYADFVTQHHLYSDNTNDTSDVWSVQTVYHI